MNGKYSINNRISICIAEMFPEEDKAACSLQPALRLFFLGADFSLNYPNGKIILSRE